MIVERTNKEVIIRLSPDVDLEDLQKVLNYARYKELSAKFKITQSQVNDIVNVVKQGRIIKRKKINK